MRSQSRNKARGAVSAALSALLVFSTCPTYAIAEQLGEAADVPVTQSEAAPQADETSQDSISEATEWQQSGECVWRVADGVLEVKPADGRETGVLGDDFSWLEVHDPGSLLYPSYPNSNITSAVFYPGVVATTCKDMFLGCSKLEIIDFSGLDTSQVTDMSEMFYGCYSLKTLDLSGFDTSNVTTMRCMFEMFDNGVSSLASINLTGFDTSSVTDMSRMFSGCSSLTSLDLVGFDTSSVSDMTYMFVGCSSLPTLDLSNFDTSSVTNMGGMFCWCSSLKSLDVSSFNTSMVSGASTSYNVPGMQSMFQGCSSLETLDVSGFDTSSVTSMSSMFDRCSLLKQLDVSGFDTSSVVPGSGYTPGGFCLMFGDCSSQQELDVSGFKTAGITSLSGMFKGCASLKSLDVSGFDTSSVADLSDMFNGCSSLNSLDLSGFDSSQLTNARGMLSNCSNLVKLNISGFDASGVLLDNRGGVDLLKGSLDSLDEFTVGEKIAGVVVPTSRGIGRTGSWVDASGRVVEAGSELPAKATTYKAQVALSEDCFTLDLSDEPYTGSPITKQIAADRLTEGEDYTVSYSNNQSVGTASIDITGQGRVTGSVHYEFNVVKATPQAEVPTGLTASWGQSLSGVSLPTGWSWDNPDQLVGEPGDNTFKATFTPSDQQSYEVLFSVDVTVRVTRALDASMFSAQLDGIAYDGTEKCPEVSTDIVPEGSYTVEYADNLNAGAAKIVIHGSEFWTGDVEIPFNIAKAQPVVPGPLHGWVGQRLSEVALPEGWAWDNSFSSLYSEGDNQFYASYSSPDPDNIESLRASITVSVETYAGNTCGSCIWDIDENGQLAIAPLPGSSEGTISVDRNVPWNEFADKITSAVVSGKVSVGSSCFFFSECTNLKSADLSGLMLPSNGTYSSEMFSDQAPLESVTLGEGFMAQGVIRTGLSGTTGRWVSSIDGVAYDSNAIPVGVATTYTVQKSDDVIGSWSQFGTCMWKIDQDGLLTISPLPGAASGRLDVTSKSVAPDGTVTHNAPWNNYGALVTAVKVTGEVTVEERFYSRNCFSECVNLENADLAGLIVPRTSSVDQMFAPTAPLNSVTFGTGFSQIPQLPSRGTGRWVSSVDGVAYANDGIPVGVAATYSPQGVDGVIGSWSQFGTCMWKVDGDGLLTIAPLPGNDSGQLGEVSYTSWDETPMPWKDVVDSIKSVQISSGVKAGKNATLFKDCAVLVNADLTNLDVSETESLMGLFENCYALKDVRFPQSEDSKLDSFLAMFRNCESIVDVNFAPMDLGGGVKNFNSLFSGCSSLESVTWGSEVLSIENMSSLFYECSSLKTIDLTGFNTSNVTVMDSAFAGCSSLTSLDVTNFDTSKVADADFMFFNCTAIKELDLSFFDTSKMTGMTSMLSGLSSLQKIKLGPKFSFSGLKAKNQCSLSAFQPFNSKSGYSFDCTVLWRNSSGAVLSAGEIPSNSSDVYG